MKEKRAEKNQVRVMILPEYGKQKLLTYADSFKDLADVFEMMNGRQRERTAANIFIGERFLKTGKSWRDICMKWRRL